MEKTAFLHNSIFKHPVARGKLQISEETKQWANKYKK
jgi:hypothetical protein